MPALVSSFVRCSSGATSVEYALIAVGVAAVIVASVQGVGAVVKADITSVQNAFK